MTSAEPAPDTADDSLPEDLTEVGRYATFADASGHGLVVLTMGEPYWLVPSGADYRLLVETRILDRAREQLERFERESIGWPPRPHWEDVPAYGARPLTPLLWAVVVSVLFHFQGEWPALTARGVMDAQAVFDRGEWWRLATALFLHADGGHLISNALIGIIVFTAVISTMGERRGWLLLAGASLTGNLLIAASIYPLSYRSLGASTAIFAGIGLLTGRAAGLMRHTTRPHRWRAMFAPFAAGIALLALYGAGGPQTDVGAHVTGFLAGLVFGLLAALVRGSRA
jgi:membrane associated rhomboid family serine protease